MQPIVICVVTLIYQAVVDFMFTFLLLHWESCELKVYYYCNLLLNFKE